MSENQSRHFLPSTSKSLCLSPSVSTWWSVSPWAPWWTPSPADGWPGTRPATAWSSSGTSTRSWARISTQLSSKESLTNSAQEGRNYDFESESSKYSSLSMLQQLSVHGGPQLAELQRCHHIPHAKPALGELLISTLQVVREVMNKIKAELERSDSFHSTLAMTWHVSQLVL